MIASAATGVDFEYTSTRGAAKQRVFVYPGSRVIVKHDGGKSQDCRITGIEGIPDSGR